MELRCPKCNNADLTKSGRADSSKNPRYRCKACGHRTTNPCGLRPEPRFNTELPKSRRYVITAAQNATGLHTGFFRSLLNYCKANQAELVVIPFRYKNPTSIWTMKNDEAEWWDSQLESYLYDGRFSINDNLTMLGDIKIIPTAVRPLSGLDTITGGDSGIVGHPKMEMRCIPTPHHRLPKMMMTTGAVTLMNYTDSKAGKKGEFHHTFGALVVEVQDGEVFHARQINAARDGSFYDLTHRYTGNKVTEAEVEAVVLGDLHRDFIDDGVYSATWGRDGILESLKPKKLVWHDVLDFYCKSHHHGVFTKVAKSKEARDDVQAEIRRAVEFIVENTPRGVKSVLVPSNHHDHLERWLKDSDWRDDPVNAEAYLQTALSVVRSTRMGESGAVWDDPFHYWVNEIAPGHKFTLLPRDESFTVKDIELSMHGDKGLNGGRGSLMGLSKVGVKSIIGHSHTPGIMDGTYQVGTSSKLRLEYNSGPSSWMHTHCVIYPNGKRTLINVVNGEWRLQ